MISFEGDFEIYLVNTTPGHNKFYDMTLKGNQITAQYGVIGKKGATFDRTYPTPDKALHEANLLLKAKLRKGYYHEPNPESLIT